MDLGIRFERSDMSSQVPSRFSSVTHVNESCHTYEWSMCIYKWVVTICNWIVMSHLNKPSHVAQVNESRDRSLVGMTTCNWVVMSHVNKPSQVHVHESRHRLLVYTPLVAHENETLGRIACIYSAVAMRVKKQKTVTHMNESRHRSPADSAVAMRVKVYKKIYK